MNISELYKYGVLSDAAYSTNDTGIELLKELNSTTLVDSITKQYSSLKYFTGGSGFAATVATDRSTGAVTIAFRGTDGPNDVPADVNIVWNGLAQNQILEMYNYVHRLSHGTGELVARYDFVTRFAPPPEGREYTTTNVTVIDENGHESVVTQYKYLDVIGVQNGLGVIDANTSFTLAGHSLGGLLAMSASRLFSGKTDAVYTYNSAGFKTAAADEFFRYFTNLPSVGSSTSFLPDVYYTNVYANDGPYVVYNPSLFSYPGYPNTSVGVSVEPRVFTHSINGLDESLAVYSLLSKLDPTLTMAQMETIIRTANSAPGLKLEGTVNAIFAAIYGDTLSSTLTNDRETLFAKVELLQSDPNVTPLFGSVDLTPLADLSATTLAQLAGQEASTFLALEKLAPASFDGVSPFAGSHDAASLALWQQDRAGTQEGQNFTSEYLAAA